MFENLIGFLPGPAESLRFKLALAAKRYRMAVDCWEFDDLIIKQMWDLAWRHDYRIDAITFLPSRFAEVLERRIEDDVPVSRVISTTLQKFTRAIPMNVAAIFDPDPSRASQWGRFGRYVERGKPFDPFIFS